MSFVLDEEHYVENPFLNQLKKLGWKIYRQDKDNPEVAKEISEFDNSLQRVYGESKKFRESFSEVILENVLRESIRKINPWIVEDQINEVVRRITTPQANTFLEINKEIHDLLLENISVSENRKTGERSPTVRYIDFKNPENNSFIAISQFKVRIPGTEKHIIPDIVLFVNGLPLVVVECKSPAISDPVAEAIVQLMRYSNRRGEKEGNEKLFWYNLFSIATSNQKAKYGTITSEYEHFYEWKDPYPYSFSDIDPDARSITAQQILIQGMLSKYNLLDILHNFTLFKETPKGNQIKVVPRYQQYRAVKKILKKLKEGKTPKDRGGIIWHTQGSGKSMTMLYTVRSMYHDDEFKNFKIVFITDRKDLEKQLFDTSKNIGFTLHPARSINELKEKLKTNTPDLVMGLIHKFKERELKTEFPILNTSPNILIMIDEAHRSQYKLLGANLSKALPNAVKIAYTGTPIEKTELTFGDYIDKYTIKQSVEDGVTLEIIYEGRAHSAEISDPDAANQRFEDVFSKMEREEQEKAQNRFIWRAYLENQDVILDKAKDMINHYVTYVFPNRLKAQVVAASRLAAIRYKSALEQALQEKIKELVEKKDYSVDLDTLKRLKVAVIISSSQNDDPVIYKREYTDETEHDKNIRSFNLPFDVADEHSGTNGNVGILVVNEMLITGFDAPIEQVMYLDNVIKEHNLLQAIARVNRVYNKDKSCGFVVDYVGVLKDLRKALSIYSNEDIDEITDVLKVKERNLDNLKYLLQHINDFFRKYGIEDWKKKIDECIDILVDEETRNEFISIVNKFNRLMDAVLPEVEALKFLTELKVLNFIKQVARNRYRDDSLSLRDASRKIREIVEEYLISKGIDPKIPPTEIFDEEFIEKLKREKSSKVKSIELEYAIKEYLQLHSEEDPELYERFSDKLKRILEIYRENWDELAKELEKLREEMKKGRENEETFGFEPKKEMPFFGLLKKELYGEKTINELSKDDIDLLIDLTQNILSIIKENVKVVDFWENYSKQKQVKSYIISNILLPNDNRNYLIYNRRNEIVQKIMELAYHLYGKR